MTCARLIVILFGVFAKVFGGSWLWLLTRSVVLWSCHYFFYTHSKRVKVHWLVVWSLSCSLIVSASCLVWTRAKTLQVLFFLFLKGRRRLLWCASKKGRLILWCYTCQTLIYMHGLHPFSVLPVCGVSVPANMWESLFVCLFLTCVFFLKKTWRCVGFDEIPGWSCQ